MKRNALLNLALVGAILEAAVGAAVVSCGSGGDSSASNTAPTSSGAGGKHGGGGTGQGGQGGGDISPDGGGGSGQGGSGGGKGVDSNYPCPGCKPFPSGGAPTCDAKVLGPPTIAYPLDGILLPPNMNVLEVQFVPPAGATLFEVDFTNSITSVKVETTCVAVPPVRGGASLGCGVTLPQGAWNDIANTNRGGDPVKVVVRATVDGSCVSASQANIEINFATEDLVGGIYYWQSATFGGIGGKTGGIYSHDFGALDPTPTPFLTASANGTCVGCHNLSRDGLRMALALDDPDADDEFNDVKTQLMDVPNRTLIGGNKVVSPGFQTFTHDHTKMVASTFKTKMDLAFAVVNGDTAVVLASPAVPGAAVKATQPDLSKDDATLIYVVPQAGTISTAGDHHFMGGSLFSTPFNAAANTLGAATPLLQASGTQNYYYPNLSPSMSFLVFNEAPDSDSFYNRKARVKLLHFPPAPGATAIDLPALNVADGLTNSGPRWSPFVQNYKGHKLLWVTFSSNRDYGLHLNNSADPANPGKPFDNCYPPESPMYDQPQPLSKAGVGYENCAEPQIWMAGILVDDDPALDAKDRSFPSFWLPFQDVNAHNHAAQWVEQIPPPMNLPDGGAGGGDAGKCGELGASCGAGSPCCADVLCCNGACNEFFTCVN